LVGSRCKNEAIGMGVVMVMFRADGQRRSFPISRDVTVIGRREDCDLRIPLGDVSRKHCRLILDGDILKVEDLGSSNGTYRNGERVQQTDLSAGDTLQVGPVVFVVQMNGFPGDDDLQPVTVQSAAAKAAAAGTALGANATTTGDDDEPAVLDDGEEASLLDDSAPAASAPGTEFDPMEALEANEGSAFDFQIDESKHGEESPVDLGESGHG
jgi:predicted component of type VI protein secretion system